ncbi:MAG TPA: hypothetical protein VL171_05390 [Verrucomicrobiae bacterium]|nr:hypothetical protein [Verrucomicrobiae bacterium]
MGLLETAREALKDLPVSDVIRERLSLALDQWAASERQASDLRAKVGRLEGMLEIERRDREKAQQELQRLRQEYQEEVRIEQTIEFRRGIRTSGKWSPFCPQCHLPAYAGEQSTVCSGHCGWVASRINANVVEGIIRKLS